MINLDQLTDGGRVHNLAGKLRGQEGREQLEIDRLDETPGECDVMVPEHIYAISTSFFVGLFGASLAALGGREPFLSKYHFDCSETVRKQIMHGIERCEAVQ